MASVALITCVDLPEAAPDQIPLLKAFEAAGVQAKMLAWDDAGADVQAFDVCVLRSCWNYYLRPEAFLAWIDAVTAKTRLVNTAETVRWNLHKRYLERLEAADVPIIPTAFARRGERTDLRTVMQARDWHDVVVKPAVSAASFRTKRFRHNESEAGQRFLDDLLKERDALVQRYMPTVESSGERALVWIDGALTHSVVKEPRFDSDVERVSEAHLVNSTDSALVQRALECIDGDIVYARIDVVDDARGNPMVSELELMEPSLFLRQNVAALDRFVTAIKRLATHTH